MEVGAVGGMGVVAGVGIGVAMAGGSREELCKLSGSAVMTAVARCYEYTGYVAWPGGRT